MKIIFGTTNPTKVDDLQRVIHELNLDVQVLSLDDIGWDRGEIEEYGSTIEENSLIKAKAILSFCNDHHLEYPIITDDSGLFVEALNGEPGIYTARYADDELLMDPSLPKHQCIYKLLRNMNGIENRRAQYRCCVTSMMPDGSYFQEFGESDGTIAESILGVIQRPYLYSVFVLNDTNVAFSNLDDNKLNHTYRHKAFRKTLRGMGIDRSV